MGILTIVISITLLAAAFVGGTLFAFSGFVTQGIGRLRADAAADAFRMINVTAVRAPLMIALFGTAALSLALAVWAFLPWGSASPWLLAGCVLYLVGVVGVTAAANVPRNDRLAAGGSWQDFAPGWQRWNHVRTASAALAAVCFLLALLVH